MLLSDRYKILGRLGAGSSGIVYVARDELLGRSVALKVMRPESQLDTEVAERFRREARACAQLQHPNIVTVYDMGEADGSTFIAMELLSGTDMRTAIRQPVKLPAPIKIQVMAQVCEALGHAHQHGIVHRDVKPSNLFLGSDQQVKILDFGIAKLSTSVLTRTGKILGTPNYMAPEQIAGENCGPLSDLFSAAIVTFEFLAGVHPFQAPFIPKRIMSGEPDGLCEVDPAFPLELQTVLGRALAREPEERYPTGEDLAAALRGVLADETWDWTETTEIAKAERVDSDGPTATVVAPLDMLDRGNSPESK